MSHLTTTGLTSAGSSRKGKDGFWANLGKGTGAVLTAIAPLAPVWAAKELNLQMTDQLDDSTFDPSKAKPRLNDGSGGGGGGATATDSIGVIFGFPRNQVFIVGGSVLAAFLLFAVLRR